MKSLTCLLATLALAVATEGPVGKVVNLLEDLKGKIEDDADMDEKDFKEHECWCKKVQASKAEMIEEGKKVVKVKESEIVEGKAKENTLQKEIEETKEEVGENQDSQAKGAKVRGTEHDENTQEIKEGKTLVNGINQVSKVFEKPALVQLDSKAAKAFQRYSPKAQTIQGILQNQLEQTESDVKQVTKEEEEGATKTFKAWMTDMKEQLGILEDKKSDEEQEEVETEVEVAEDTETKVDTEEQIKADKAFLQEAETSCATRKAEYLNRTALRSIELGGISKAMEILDAKRELLSKTFKGASFLQLTATSKLQNVLGILKAKAQQTHSARLALLASQVQNALPEGAFTTVLEEIEKMFEKLKGEAASDKKKKDHCKAEYQSITQKSNNYAFLIQKQSAKIETLENKMSALESEKAAAAAEVAEIDADLEKATSLRTKANKAFLKAKADDETGMTVLKETSDAVSSYYKEHAQAADEASLVQYDPDKLSNKRKELKNEENKYTISKADSQQSAADSVLALIDRLVQNLQTEIKDAQSDEAKSQSDFEQEKKLLQTSKAKLNKKIVSIEAMLATHSGSKGDTDLAKKGTEADLKAQKDYKASIQEECDFMLENFDDRAADRAGEMEGLTRAKELLSGASLVQEAQKASEASAAETEKTKEKGSLSKYLGLGK